MKHIVMLVTLIINYNNVMDLKHAKTIEHMNFYISSPWFDPATGMIRNINLERFIIGILAVLVVDKLSIFR